MNVHWRDMLLFLLFLGPDILFMNTFIIKALCHRFLENTATKIQKCKTPTDPDYFN